MGYDMNLMVFKKRSLERTKEHTSVDVLKPHLHHEADDILQLLPFYFL